MQTEIDKSILASILQKGMQIRNNCPGINEMQCGELLLFSKRQAILPIIWMGIKDLDLSNEWKEKFKIAFLQEVVSCTQRDNALKEIERTLNQEHIAFIPLKGAVLRNLYPHSWMRTSSDLDVLVHAYDLEHAIRAIENYTGFRAQKKGYHDVSMLSEVYHLDLHFSLKENSEKLDPLLQKVWDYARADNVSFMNTLTPEYQIFHVISHMSHHFVRGGLGIRPFIDLWLLQHKTQYDDDVVRDMCGSCGILKFYDASTEVADYWMENKEISSECKPFLQSCMKGGVFGSVEQQNAQRQIGYKGVGFLFSRIFVPEYKVKELFPDETGKKHGNFYYQIKRWKYWLRKERREELKKQSKAILNTNSDEIEFVRRIMQFLELDDKM